MKVFRNLNDIKDIKNPVVTTGSFDGVHVGHTKIIERINRLAREINGESVLISFDPHPRKVLFPDTAGNGLKLINSQREKVNLLERTGLDNLIVIHFTLEFSKTSSDDFVKDILVDRIGAKKVVIGFNHHFGHNREGGYDKLYEQGKKWGFSVEEIPEQELHNETVSSTKIRKALQNGDIQKANAYLDHRYVITGELRLQKQKSNTTGENWYSVTIEEECKLIPPPGLYAVCTYYKGSQYKGIVQVEPRNTFIEGCDHNKVVSVSFFDLEESLHGRISTILFAKRMAPLPESSDEAAVGKKLKNTTRQIKEMIY
ncbi:MAG: bifunctional riboflavin kinase/FMN adenylyltransferase [Bacteroidota bacterium]